MQPGRRLSRFQANRFTIRGLLCHSRHCAPAFRYRHILVATSLSIADRAALMLGFELAAVHSATLTLLHVLPRPLPDRTPFGLGAIRLLHAAADDLRGIFAADTSNAAARPRLCRFVEDIVPRRLLGAVCWRGECLSGDVAETIVAYVNESAIDLAILSAKPIRWWLPVVPLVVRTIERRARANVIVMRGQAPSRLS